MDKNLDQFESFVKASLENHEEPYNPASWDAVSKQLNNPFYKSKWFVSAAVVAAIAGGVYLTLPNSDSTITKPIASNQTEAKTPTKNNKVVDNKAITNNAEEEVKENTSNITQDTPNNSVTEPVDVVVSNEGTKTNDEVASEKDVASISENNTESLNEDSKPAAVQTSTTDEKNVTENSNNDEVVPQQNIVDYDDFTIDFDLKNTYCEGDRISVTPMLSSSLNENDFQYSWLKNGVVISKEKSLKNIKLVEGQNNITLVVKHRKGDESKEITKNTEFYQSVTFDPIKDKSTIKNNHIFTLNREVKEVTWNFGDGTSSNELSSQHTYNNRGKYTVTMVAKNYAGCVFTKTDYVDVGSYYNYKADWPFIPDGNGLNDEFFPLDLKQTMINNNLTQKVKFTVIDRSGKPIFVSSSIDNGWKGRDMEGKMVRLNEVYVWKLEFVNELGNPEVYLGTVTAGSN